MKEVITYRVDAVNKNTNEVILGCVADTIDDLSRCMPLSINGRDYVLMHSDINNQDDWYTRVQALEAGTGRWVTIDDPRVYEEDLRKFYIVI